ncbi:MAG: CvpA family protein [Firmicutes bacterium]|nr:CvpA family protein [Bacillota bacterium]
MKEILAKLPMIVDLAIGAMLVISVLVGSYRGLLKSIIYTVKNVVAIFGAAYVSKLFEPQVSELLLPIFKRKMVNVVLDKLPRTLESLQIPEVNLDFSGMGLNLSAVNEYLNQVRASANNSLLATTSEVYSQMAARIEEAAEGLLSTAVRGLLFIVAFFVILIFFAIFLGILDNLVELPVIKTFNHMGGAILGLLQAALIIWLILYVLKLTNLSMFDDFAETTILYNYFWTHSPLDATNFLKDNAHTLVSAVSGKQ